MPHNSPAHRDSLHKLDAYVAGPTFLKNTAWSPGDMGHIAVDNSTASPMVAVVVGKINDARLNCGPGGNFTPKFGNFEKAKFTFILGCPHEPAYSEDWEHMLTTLDKVQNTIASTNSKRDLVDTSTRSLRFGAPIFTKRVLVFLSQIL